MLRDLGEKQLAEGLSNGMACVVEQYDEASKRFKVRIAENGHALEGQQKLIRIDNLQKPADKAKEKVNVLEGKDILHDSPSASKTGTRRSRSYKSASGADGQ